MNERIKQLALQAGYSKDFLAIGLLNNMEKFAELIVSECADIIEELAEKLSEQRPNSNYDSVAYECAEVIKTHFGVEE
jgi:hypothetical protein